MDVAFKVVVSCVICCFLFLPVFCVTSFAIEWNEIPSSAIKWTTDGYKEGHIITGAKAVWQYKTNKFLHATMYLFILMLRNEQHSLSKAAGQMSVRTYGLWKLTLVRSVLAFPLKCHSNNKTAIEWSFHHQRHKSATQNFPNLMRDFTVNFAPSRAPRTSFFTSKLRLNVCTMNEEGRIKWCGRKECRRLNVQPKPDNHCCELVCVCFCFPIEVDTFYSLSFCEISRFKSSILLLIQS